MSLLLRRYLLPKGRLSRRNYWLHVFVPLLIIAYVNEVQARLFGTPNVSGWIQVISLWPVLVALGRRFHDLNRVGWWAILYFAPAVAMGAAQRMDLMAYATVTKGLGIVILGIIPGTIGVNSFGPPDVKIRPEVRATG
jgi:uncharacterized membrane protein YhaH (DUF805 family)